MEFADILENRPAELQELAQDVRSILLKIDKRIDENVYGGKKVRIALYSIGGDTQVLYGLSIGKDHVQLYLHHADKPGVDVAGLKLEGKGKHAKHVKIKTLNTEVKKQVTAACKSILEVSGY